LGSATGLNNPWADKPLPLFFFANFLFFKKK